MGSWRKRKKEVDVRTEETNEQYGMKEIIESATVTGVSGKVNADCHYRTLADGRIRVCKNPQQDVHGESLRNAHLMRRVMGQARDEYNDPDRRSAWEREYAEALRHGKTRVKVLWNYITQQIYRRESAANDEKQ